MYQTINFLGTLGNQSLDSKLINKLSGLDQKSRWKGKFIKFHSGQQIDDITTLKYRKYSIDKDKAEVMQLMYPDNSTYVVIGSQSDLESLFFWIYTISLSTYNSSLVVIMDCINKNSIKEIIAKIKALSQLVNDGDQCRMRLQRIIALKPGDIGNRYVMDTDEIRKELIKQAMHKTESLKDMFSKNTLFSDMKYIIENYWNDISNLCNKLGDMDYNYIHLNIFTELCIENSLTSIWIDQALSSSLCTILLETGIGRVVTEKVRDFGAMWRGSYGDLSWIVKDEWLADAISCLYEHYHSKEMESQNQGILIGRFDIRKCLSDNVDYCGKKYDEYAYKVIIEFLKGYGILIPMIGTSHIHNFSDNGKDKSRVYKFNKDESAVNINFISSWALPYKSSELQLSKMEQKSGKRIGTSSEYIVTLDCPIVPYKNKILNKLASYVNIYRTQRDCYTFSHVSYSISDETFDDIVKMKDGVKISLTELWFKDGKGSENDKGSSKSYIKIISYGPDGKPDGNDIFFSVKNAIKDIFSRHGINYSFDRQ